MVQIGKYNRLKVVKFVDFGVYLDGGKEFDEILLPDRYVPEEIKIGESLDVFIYTDSEDRIIATTEKPKAIVGEIAFLKVVSVSSFGTFLDWGLSKDLLLPAGEQNYTPKVGELCPVKVFYHERTKRVAATQRVEKGLKKTSDDFVPGQEVDLVALKKTDLGFSVIVNGTHLGLLFKNEIFEPIAVGDKKKGYVGLAREDEKLDLTLNKPGYAKVDSISKGILNQLKEAGGFLAVTDKTSPEIIYREFKMSKKVFKKALGTLYKQRLITLEPGGIRLV